VGSYSSKICENFSSKYNKNKLKEIFNTHTIEIEKKEEEEEEEEGEKSNNYTL
jgi:hypothetical protein